ncbi:MAG: ATP-binding protein [Alkalibacterium sp.]|nr:ATP-binding protein [Alkalibacterium sp.]
MVNDILQLSKLEQRQISGVRQNVDVGEVIEEVLKILSQKISLKQIHIVVNKVKDVEIEINQDHLKQIIINLVSNAVSYTPEKGRVTIAVGERDNGLQLEISDTGIGIPKDQLSRIFERFYRVRQRKKPKCRGHRTGLVDCKMDH